MPSLADSQIFNSATATALTSLADFDDSGSGDKWFLTAWGLFTRDFDCALDYHDESGVTVDDPIYARTFRDALVFLPRCDWFLDAFRRIPGNKSGFEATRRIYWVTDGQSEIFDTSAQAEDAWIAQGDPWASIFATLYFEEALARIEAYDVCFANE
ncbi:hypothetical protein B0H12DRAFT_1078235 [Mycena haematopus]|nr:hypothetical protein B0H12DRAFT_1078235 [Mycena haematopus]